MEEKKSEIKGGGNKKKLLDASKTGFDLKLGRLPFEIFEKWFNGRYDGDAKKIHAELVKNLK